MLEANDQLSILISMKENLETLHNDLAQYFVFDPQKYNLEELFGDLKMFKDQFKKAQAAITEEREARVRAERARAAGQKSSRVNVDDCLQVRTHFIPGEISEKLPEAGAGLPRTGGHSVRGDGLPAGGSQDRLGILQGGQEETEQSPATD